MTHSFAIFQQLQQSDQWTERQPVWKL